MNSCYIVCVVLSSDSQRSINLLINVAIKSEQCDMDQIGNAWKANSNFGQMKV